MHPSRRREGGGGELRSGLRGVGSVLSDGGGRKSGEDGGRGGGGGGGGGMDGTSKVLSQSRRACGASAEGVRGEGGRGESKRHHYQRQGGGDPRPHAALACVWEGVREAAVATRLEL
mmetsp:Transcript_36729/g.91465  ORF Transcript_36729/g.91465 Transcript_36729/m.91465 type:complete len:117 (+) Transcript_36729:2308-2658(+)